MVSSVTLASAPGMEYHHLMLGKLEGHVVQIKREGIDADEEIKSDKIKNADVLVENEEIMKGK